MNNQCFLSAAVAALALAAQVAWAHGDDKPPAKPSTFDAGSVEETPFGRQGDPKKVGRTIRVDMVDTMRFVPGDIHVRRGETVRFVARNRGRVLHEMVLGTPAELEKHAQEMRKFPEMEHDEAYMTHVKPGANGEIVWQFTRAGAFRLACLIPGHFEAGMVGKVTVK
jgi:uncharacterized cupredoxin-like copper-binding protein